MFDNRIKEEFVICYDKFTKPMAVSLWNALGRKEGKCVIWNKKTYIDNEPKLSNWNKIVLLNEELIKTNLANPNLKEKDFSKGVLIKHEGNTLGIYINPNFKYEPFLTTFGMPWNHYIKIILPELILLGPINILIKYLLLLRNEKKRVKTKLLFDAINKLKGETIEKFLSDEQVV